MPLDFSLSVPQQLVAAGVPSTVTVTLTGSGTLASNATFAASGVGSASSIPLIPTGAGPGATTTFTYTTSQSGQVSVTSAGGLVASHSLLITVAQARETTAAKIISQALGALGVRGIGETVQGNEAQDALQVLNTLIDSWRTDSLYAYASQTITGTVQGGSQTITIGPTGDIVTAYRPIRIEAGSYFSTGGIDYRLPPITTAQFGDIPYKNIGTIGPDGVAYDPSLPNGTLYMFPYPSGNVTVSLQALMQVDEFTDLTTGYVLAPGCERALVYALAEELAPLYQTMLSPTGQKNKADAIRTLRRVNHVTPALDIWRTRGNVLVGWEN